MEQTFMTIHNLSHDANILFASESVVDILGYQPYEVQGKSCFDYFHPDEVPFARSVHNRGVLLDKAAVLHYARIASKDGRWVSCECCFTVVHNVLVACTSIYRRGKKSERRAIEAPHIRRIFSCSPRDPRYHMLEHLSPKFRMQPMEREPRAALILNRFTRTLSIMFATNAVSSILGVPPDQLQGKSLYECITENCWSDAIKCLESAKANDSIAYLRFWSRDPRVQEESEETEGDAEMEDQVDTTSEKDSDGGVRLDNLAGASMDDSLDSFVKREAADSPRMHQPTTADELNVQRGFSAPSVSRAQTANTQGPQRPRAQRGVRGRRREPIPTRELEAVVSCTSDGLVMVLRKARPPIPFHPPMVSTEFENGLFAAPWSEYPVRPDYPLELFYDFQSPFLPHHGKPSGESQPPDGIPIWDPASPETSSLGPRPPSSGYWGDRSTRVHRAESISIPLVHPLPTPGSTTEGGQGHIHTSSRFNKMHSGHSDNSLWPNSATTRPFQEPRPFSHSILQRQWADGVWPEVTAPFGRHNTDGSRSD
ncbi:hypothetical protein GGR58DRAFT_511454 [Xylaria digitata]|nr:hypothetical protein GGR58DRAFT_511454 [Xylaria digitata]